METAFYTYRPYKCTDGQVYFGPFENIKYFIQIYLFEQMNYKLQIFHIVIKKQTTQCH